MLVYNILVACDQAYYDAWVPNLITSIRHFNPEKFNLHVHVVNAEHVNEILGVNYTYENQEFASDDQRLGYLQSVRFLIVANKFALDDCVITVDCDSICLRPIDNAELNELFSNQHVLQHHKDSRWMAGFVAFGANSFKFDYAEELKKTPVKDWLIGHDQTTMKEIAEQYQFLPLNRSQWMSVGKIKGNSAFLTLKGRQKYSEKWLNPYYQVLEKCNAAPVVQHRY